MTNQQFTYCPGSEDFRGALILDRRGRIVRLWPDPGLLEELLGQPVQGKAPESLFPELQPAVPVGQWVPVSTPRQHLLLCAWPAADGRAGGFLIYLQPAQPQNGRQELQDVSLELQAILAASYDLIYVSDGEGNTLRVSAGAERLIGVKESELVGKNVRDLERAGLFRPSAIRRVLETGQPLTVIQDTLANRRLLVSASPIRDEQNRLVRVISTSRDITELNQLQQQLDETRKLATRYLEEIEKLRRGRSSGSDDPDGAVVRSPKMKEVVSLARQVALVDSTVLILGESGVGKEVLARLIHQSSPRHDGPLITINCGAIPGELLESELFGYERGAFTGASASGKPGLFELACGGTLFLDEVGELPLPVQVKLLRALQQREVTRVGGLKPVPLNVRIITATNRDLQEMVRTGRFREDLYYRLNVVPIHIPPLRERREEIAALVHHFLERFNARYGRQVGISSAALEVLEQYPWPGNVRELENLVERMVVVGSGHLIDVQDLPQALRSQSAARPGAVQVQGLMPLQQAIEELEARLILDAYERFGNTYKVAEVLGINQSTVVRKLNKYRKDAEVQSPRMPRRISVKER